MTVGADALTRARELHDEFPVVDCHSDIPVDLWARRRAGEPAPLSDDYANRLRQGGVRLVFMTVGGDQATTMDGLGRPDLRALELIDDVVSEAENDDGLRIVRTGADLDRLLADRALGIILHFEGLAPLRASEALVRSFHRLGVRSAQLTWNQRNAVADGVGERVPAGLSERGRELIVELAGCGTLMDVSHLAPHGFWDLVELLDGPIVASHANAAAVWPHPRNLEDDQIWAIASSGGLVGACFFPSFIGEDPGLPRLIDHVDHIVELVGIDHVGVGPDYVEFARELIIADMNHGSGSLDYANAFDFADGLRETETLPVFTAGLIERGYAETDIAKIIGGNALRVLRSVLPDE
jgi:membrane dipeptidase